MFAAIWRWLTGMGEEARISVKLDGIQTWTELFNENREDFVEALNGEESPRFAEDAEINDKVSLYEGDITCLEVDGIVRSTDRTLKSGDGISGAIRAAAGCSLTVGLNSLGICQPGEAKTTPGYALKSTYIVHTVGPQNEQPQCLEKCYMNCLEQMRLKGMKSLAFCCISTGIRGYPNDKAVLVALKTVRLWLEDLKKKQLMGTIDRIVFCLFSELDVYLYTFWMQIFFPCPPEPEMLSRSPEPEIFPGIVPPENVDEKNAYRDFETSISSPKVSIEMMTQQRTLRPLPGFIEITSEPDMISLDDDTETKRAKMPCGHVIGPDSMTATCRSLLMHGKFRFYCTSPNCNQEWDYFLVRHVACLTNQEMRMIEKRLAANFLQKEKGIQMCPGKGCKVWCSRTGSGNRVSCPICKSKFCWTCLHEWKGLWSCGNPGCDGKDKRIQILATCPTKRINNCKDCPTVRGCPRCGILIEHTKRCGHVECTNCTDYGFCFICLKEKVNGRWQCRPYFNQCVLAPRQTSLPGAR